jgi:hypothetical protein
MQKFFVCLFVFLQFTAISQTLSPDQFLGYRLGDKYTPHFRIVEYFRHLSQTAPDLVRLEQYGQTNEGRPLMLAFISSKDNISRLEQIRMNNLRIAGVAKDRMAPVLPAPAIVWLSYNVHGNETSSSEAAMLTAYELVRPRETKAVDWLQNTVVVLDPCINPDGRDRYVNWFNSVTGFTADPLPFSREHMEPWPGGRTNHYLFDLNRDWAWQTQKESQERMKRYNQWLPHVHVDFHEQSFDAPYYFAPAAEPLHAAITPWQREFQTMIGRNNARYFDQNGWLYFTKERFDLFYPSYGDTYPTFKGAIGMTYEQGGGGRAGSAVITEAGDTLRLSDRLLHHYTTGISTIEITSVNATKVLTEFRDFYDKARSAPAGEFKGYLLKSSGSDNLRVMKSLLDKNQIIWQYAGAQQVSGFNYFTNKNETYKPKPGDIVINTNQPHSTLLNVLFERSSVLSDSVTYDITAWSLPYAYAIETIGTGGFIGNTAASGQPERNKLSETNAYAYAIKWNGTASTRFLAQMLRSGVRVRFSEEQFSIKGQNFEKGTLLITRASNEKFGNSLASLIAKAIDSTGVEASVVQSGFVDKGFDFGSDRIRVIDPPKVAVLAGDNVSSYGMGEIWHFFEREIGYPVHIVYHKDLNAAVLRQISVLILPDGQYRTVIDKEKNSMLHNWVSSGGKLIALENAVSHLANSDWGLKEKKYEERKDDKKQDEAEVYRDLRKYGNRERDEISSLNPGSIFRVELDNSHPLAYGYGDQYYTLKMDDRIMEFIKEGGWNVGVIKRNALVSGFTGSKTKEKLKDGALFGVLEVGRGSLVFFADNTLFRNFWESGKLMMSNAVFLVGE